MEIIAIVNKKGGVGKTTTSLALAAGLSKQNKKILAIDLDSQGNFSQTSSADASVIGAMELLTGQDVIQNTIQQGPGYDLISASSALSGADGIITQTGKEYRLKEALYALDDGAAYDYVIIDTPPSIGILTVNALTAASKIIVAAQADSYSAAGFIELTSSIQAIQKYCNPLLRVEGILLTRYNARTLLSQQQRDNFKSIAEKIHTKVFETAIRENIAIKEAQTLRQSIFDYAPKSNGSIDYMNFLYEFLRGEKNGKKA